MQPCGKGRYNRVFRTMCRVPVIKVGVGSRALNLGQCRVQTVSTGYGRLGAVAAIALGAFELVRGVARCYLSVGKGQLWVPI